MAIQVNDLMPDVMQHEVQNAFTWGNIARKALTAACVVALPQIGALSLGTLGAGAVLSKSGWKDLSSQEYCMGAAKCLFGAGLVLGGVYLASRDISQI